MRNLAPILFVALAIGAVTCTKQTDESPATDKLLTDVRRYVVFMKPTFMEPLVLDTTFYQKSIQDQEKIRIDHKNKVQAFCDTLRLTVDPSQIFVDVAVAFVANMNGAKADSLRKNSRVQSATLDVRIEGRPIQQGTPIPQGRPIQQDEDMDNIQEWGLTLKDNANKVWISCAVTKAGGRANVTTERKIWIVDTGIAGPNNPFLNVDSDLGKNFTVVPPDNKFYDDNGHGTLVAGVAAAKRVQWDANNKLFLGVSVGASVVPVKVLDAQGSGDWSNVLAGLNYITSFPRTGDVINLSLGDPSMQNCNTDEIPELKTTIENAAIKHFVVMASGNDGGDAANSGPGCLNGRNLFTVAAVTCGKQCALFSNYGAPPVDWVAVGTDVLSTSLKNSAGKWTFMVVSGTSLSAGIISGVIHVRGGEPLQGRKVECSTLPGNSLVTYHFGRWRSLNP